jgi:multiple sugar transport system permease protein
MNNRGRSRARQSVLHVALASGAVVILAPIVVMAVTSFLPENHVFEGIPGLRHPTSANYAYVWSQLDWPHLYFDSAFVTITIVVGQVAVAVPAGYVLARWSAWRGRVAMWVLLLCLVVPVQVIAVPLYLIFIKIGWVDTFQALIVPFLGSAFAIFMFRQFIVSIPGSIFDAARLDGVGPIAVIWRVVIPNMRPAIYAFAVFSMVEHYNDLFWPSIVLDTQRVWTVPFAVAGFTDPNLGVAYGPATAAGVLALAPLIAVFLLTQRQLARGIAVSVS